MVMAQLIFPGPSQERIERWALFDRVRVVDQGEQDRDDVLAPPAPVVGAGAAGLDQAGRVGPHADRIGVDVAAFDVRLEEVTAAGDLPDRAFAVVLLATPEGLGGCAFAHHGFG